MGKIFIAYITLLGMVILFLFSSIANSRWYRVRTRLIESIARPVILRLKQQESRMEMRLLQVRADHRFCVDTLQVYFV